MNVNKRWKRFLCLMLVLVTVCTGITITPKTAVGAATNPSSSAMAEYGLKEDVQDGVILHCWDWSFNNIKEQMPQIAAAGYTAIQTSPIQEAKEATKGKTNNNWWVLYQPKSFKIGTTDDSALGTKDEFIAMCDEAHKYGVKVIVDVVANHLGNQSGYDKSNAIADDIRNDSSCWHTNGLEEISNYSDRNRVTHYSLGGLPDLNTESPKVQEYVLNFLKECIDAGADGFRFDAAKHISVKAEGDEFDFWENTLEEAKVYAKTSRNIDLYAYGEILYGTEGPAISAYTQYMSVTENHMSDNIRNAVNSGNAAGAATSYFSKGAPADKLVMWAESHDTYSNDSKESTGVSNENIKKTWALVASRADATALYYVRTAGWRAGNMGEIGTWDWKSDEVIAVNKFHNFFHGESEYLTNSGNIAYNERGTSGVVLVNCQGNGTSVSVPAHKIADGVYTDQITGNTFTVSNGTISGTIGSTGIAVVYNAVVEPIPTISSEGQKFSTDTLSLTIGLKNATRGTYKIGNSAAINYTSSTTISIGDGMKAGDKVVVTLTATDGTKNNTRSYTFEKIEKVNRVAYINKPSGWLSNIHCYVYDAETGITNGEFPGQLMTYDSSTGYYKYEIPDTIDDARVIFYSYGDDRFPADGEGGLSCPGEYLYNDGLWKPLKETVFKAPYEYGLYFRNDDGWDGVYMYCWNDSSELVKWPGTQMTNLGDGIYGIKVSNNLSNMEYVVFSSGAGVQTHNLKLVMNSLYNFTGVEMKAVYEADDGDDNEEDTNKEDDSGSTQVVVPPAAVTGFTYSGRTAATITLKWAKNTSADGYVIEQYKSGKWTVINTIDKNSVVSHKVTGLSPSTTYKFRIKSYKKNESTKVYATTYATKSVKTLPSTVSGFTSSGRTAASITLKWTKNTSADGYELQQYKSGKWTTIKTITKNSVVSHKITGLSPSKTYKFRIRSYKTDGSKKGYALSYTTKSVKTLPSTVKSFTYKTRTATSITLKWAKNTSADGYVIQQYKGGKWTTIKTITKNGTVSHKVTGLSPSKTYKFRIRPYKNDGSKKVYALSYTTKSVKTLPSTVKSFTYKARTAKTITLKWAKNTSADGYVIEQYKGGKWVTIKTITKNSTVSYKVTGLKKSTTYKFRIKAYKKDGSTKLYGTLSTKSVKTLAK